MVGEKEETPCWSDDEVFGHKKEEINCWKQSTVGPIKKKRKKPHLTNYNQKWGILPKGHECPECFCMISYIILQRNSYHKKISLHVSEIGLKILSCPFQ